MAESFDPYLQLPPAVPLRPAQNNTVRLEMTNQTFDARDGGEEEEEFYMQMTPATSVENVRKETRPHKKVSLTHSYEPQTNASRVNAVSPHRMSLPYDGGHQEDEEEIYCNEDYIGDDADSQENYEAMDLSEHHINKD